MVQNIMKAKEVKRIISNIEKSFLCNLEVNPSDYVFMINDKDKIYFAKKEVFSLDVKSFAIGIYFGTVTKSGLRPSMELAQLIGKTAKKNIYDINSIEAKEWMKGTDLEISSDKLEEGLVLVRYGKNILSCALYKDNNLLNYVPKQRRIDMI